jgi:hypothetical protein
MSALLMGHVIKYARALSGTTLLMLIVLADCADDEDHLCWPSFPTLADRVRISERQARRVVADLVAKGYVEVAEHGGGSKSNQYRILDPYIPDTAMSPRTLATPLTQLCPGGEDTAMSREPSYNHQEILIEEEIGNERMILNILASTPGYKFDWNRDLSWIRTLLVEFPLVDLPSTLRDAQTWILDHPNKVKNFRLFFRKWLQSDITTEKSLSRMAVAASANDPWAGVPPSTPIPKELL